MKSIVRLVQYLDLTHVFAIPGDYNLHLLDLLKDSGVNLVYSTNELNMAYTADGFARACGKACFITTFGVGSLSAMNGFAGSVSESCCVLQIVVGPRSCDSRRGHRMHHTLGRKSSSYENEMYSRICSSFSAGPDDIEEKVSTAIHILSKGECVHFLVSMDAIDTSDTKQQSSVPSSIQNYHHPVNKSDDSDLLLLVLGDPSSVLVLGHKCRYFPVRRALLRAVKAARCSILTMPDGYGVVPSSISHRIYWPCVQTDTDNLVHSASRVCYLGCVFTDYNTTGFRHRMGPSDIHLAFVSSDALAHTLLSATFPLMDADDDGQDEAENEETVHHHQRRFGDSKEEEYGSGDGSLQQVVDVLNRRQAGAVCIIVETGTSWFTGMDVHIRKGDDFQIQMQYGSIGWSLPASVGYAMARPSVRVVCLIGDGSFQMTAQALSTAARYRVSNLDIVLIKNGRYVIEDAINSSEYNNLNSWDYTIFTSSVGFANSSHPVSFLAMNSPSSRFFEHVVPPTDVPRRLKDWGEKVREYNASTCRASSSPTSTKSWRIIWLGYRR